MKRAAVLLSALLLLLPAARAQPSPVTRIQLICALWVWGGSVPYDAAGPFSDVTQEDDGATAVAWAYDLGIRRPAPPVCGPSGPGHLSSRRCGRLQRL